MDSVGVNTQRDDDVVEITVPFSEQPSTSQASTTNLGITFFTILQILENLHIIGLSSLNKWERVIEELQNSQELLNDPVLVQLFFCLKHFYKIFFTHVNCDTSLSQNQVEQIRFTDLDFEDLMKIFKPELEKKPFNEKAFSFNTVQKIASIIRKVLNYQHKAITKTIQNPVKRTQLEIDFDEKNKKKFKSGDDKHSSSSSDSSSEDDDTDSEDNFAKLFKKKQSNSLKISQLFQYNTGNLRRKITTPGEKGNHLIKIEITDTKDLKSCRSEKFYWQKINKKGYFLLNTNDKEDQDTLDQLVNILARIGTKVSKIKNAKFESFEANDNKK
ncbi:uncharacterized protein LOC128985776 isoform X2 [Macrosteles quadrilineatus]|uniref:uncharacterized protein LOC128985774 isoform X2 n=1 Tax=Macrosteles quadrilineatus TaxID=74068 RepID=UPI0023E0BBF6|nr:uncharacterized protein LOC128985774 isoform X2 [Macrosteles quadrilineatus]XP_054261619.1 uncharacterized protein LOC128985776 isoform X2 [Macrosteles quadrilineatus]